MSVLQQLLEVSRERTVALHPVRERLERQVAEQAATRGFARNLRERTTPIAVIAEFKRRSPSKGALQLEADVLEMVAAYEAGGASAVSVLTEPSGFGGSLEDLTLARGAINLPVLRKDFLIDEIQLLESRAFGADAVLLIAAAFESIERCRSLARAAQQLSLDVLVEVHDLDEARSVADFEHVIFGVNARNLATFEEDLDSALELRSVFPPDALVVAESAIRSVEAARRASEAGFAAVLVGELLMRSHEPAAMVRALANLRPSDSNSSEAG